VESACLLGLLQFAYSFGEFVYGAICLIANENMLKEEWLSRWAADEHSESKGVGSSCQRTAMESTNTGQRFLQFAFNFEEFTWNKRSKNIELIYKKLSSSQARGKEGGSGLLSVDASACCCGAALQTNSK